MRRSTGMALVAAAVWMVDAAVAEEAAPRVTPPFERVDVPIRQTVLPNGDVRYSVPITIGGGAPIDAQLDTGSFGVRVLGGAVSSAQYEATDQERNYPFSGGARFSGVLAKAVIGIGAARTGGPALFQLIRSVDCVEQMPNCFASKLDQAQYRIGGDGIPGQGFQALIGTSLRRAPNGPAADNPLATLGSERWIVDVPVPGSPDPGHLVINPTDEETSAFKTVRLAELPGAGDGPHGWRDAALKGCVVRADTKERLCGLTVLDSGAPGFMLRSTEADAPSAWPDGTAAAFELALDGGETITLPFTAGAGRAERMQIVPQRGGGETRLSAGSLPFTAFSVLYDARQGLLGFKPHATAKP